MKGHPDVIAYLNLVLKNELTAVNQYFLHARMLENWGVAKMARYEYAQSIDEMKHADLLIKRILVLEGLPNLQDLGRLMIGENVKEVIECDKKVEEKAIPELRDGIKLCESVLDYVTRDLLGEILISEEDHLDHLDTQLQMIEMQGLANYIQLQSEAKVEE